MRSLLIALAVLCVTRVAPGGPPRVNDGDSPAIHVDTARKSITLEEGRLGIRVNLNGGCWIDSLWIGSKAVLGPGGGAYSGVRAGSLWRTSRALTGDPLIVCGPDSVKISNIRYSCGDTVLDESWTFAFDGESLLWTIDRMLPEALTLDENAFPAFGFGSIGEFDAALLGTGGVAWFRLFNDTALAYGVHTGLLTFWKTGDECCLELASVAGGGSSAVALSRADTSLLCAFSLSPADLAFRYDSTTHRRRFVRGTTDVWQATRYPAGAYRQVLRISSPL